MWGVLEGSIIFLSKCYPKFISKTIEGSILVIKKHLFPMDQVFFRCLKWLLISFSRRSSNGSSFNRRSSNGRCFNRRSTYGRGIRCGRRFINRGGINRSRFSSRWEFIHDIYMNFF